MGKDTYTGDEELDLRLEWPAAVQDREALRAWLHKERPHLLRSYDADFLVNAVERAREPQQRPI
jgi:hypothetical protein